MKCVVPRGARSAPLVWVFCLGLYVGALLPAQAQDSLALSDDYYRMGMEIFDFTHRKQAAELFTLATQFNPNNAKAQFMAGKAIMLTIRKEMSLSYYLRAYNLDPQVDPNIVYYVGQGYQYSEQFDSALVWYSRFIDATRTATDSLQVVFREESKRNIRECQNAKIFYAFPAQVKIDHLPDIVNSEYADYAPTISADESMLIFTSRRQEGNLNSNLAADLEFYEDIYIAYRKPNGEWTPARNIGPPLNDRYHNASVNLSPDGTKVFVYHDEYGGSLFVSYRKPDSTWTYPQMIREINTDYHEGSASVTADNKTLYFTSDRPGGYGGTDIYVARKLKNGKWGDIKNLGPVINTPRNEEAPFISARGKHLYFSSDGHIGMGDLDIFRSTYDSATGTWSEPVNMGYPINSVEDDIYFALTGDERYAYFSSVKLQNHGEQDIYRADMKYWAPVTFQEMVSQYEEKKRPPADSAIVAADVHFFRVFLSVLDAQSSQPINARLEVRAEADQMTTVTEESTGHFRISSAPAFKVVAHSPGYLPSDEIEFSYAPGADEQTRVISLRKIKRDLPEVLDILFPFDSDVPLSFSEVDKLVRLLRESTTLQVQIAGHTDDIGPAAYNQQLSERRAHRVRAYIIRNGVEDARVTAIGYGMSQPKVPNTGKANRRTNRRTEFTLTERP